MKYKKTLVTIMAFSALLSACTQNEESDVTKDEHANHTAKEHEDYVAKEKEAQKETDNQHVSQTVKVETKLLVKEEVGMFLDISYPVLSGMADEKKQAELNEEFLEIAKSIEAQTREDEKALVEAGAEPHAGGSLDVTVYVNDETLISLDLTGYLYSGGANGTPFHNPFVYDLKEGKKLTLADLFEEDTIPEKELVALLNDLFRNTDYGDLILEEITNLSPEQGFYLTENEVVFTFEKYEYTAGAAGAPEISVAKESLPHLKATYQ